jgi:putative spermidine/putrescine transport system permease protein
LLATTQYMPSRPRHFDFLAIGANAAAGRLRSKRFMTFLFSFNLPSRHVVSAMASCSCLPERLLPNFRTASAGSSTDGLPILVQDPFAIGIILEYIWKEVPFIGVVDLAVLQSIGDDYEAVARTLGASPLQRFRYVLLPLIMPATLSVSVLVLAFTFGEFVIPSLLGQYPATPPVLAAATPIRP